MPPLPGLLKPFYGLWWVRGALTIDGGGLPVAIAYAGGFATGTFVGGKISSRFIRLNITCQIVTSAWDEELVERMRAGIWRDGVHSSQFGGEKYMLFCEIPSTRLEELKALVHEQDPKAFFMVQETKYVFNGFVKSK